MEGAYYQVPDLSSINPGQCFKSSFWSFASNSWFRRLSGSLAQVPIIDYEIKIFDFSLKVKKKCDWNFLFIGEICTRIPYVASFKYNHIVFTISSATLGYWNLMQLTLLSWYLRHYNQFSWICAMCLLILILAKRTWEFISNLDKLLNWPSCIDPFISLLKSFWTFAVGIWNL